MDQHQLAEPRTLADLDRLIAQRNEAFVSVARDLPKRGTQEFKALMIRREQVLSELRRVVADLPASPGPIRNFLGGLGLIVRRGFDDAITGAGLALLRSSAAPDRRAA